MAFHGIQFVPDNTKIDFVGQRFFAFIVSGLVVLMIGENPFEAVAVIIYGAFGYGDGFGYTGGGGAFGYVGAGAGVACGAGSSRCASCGG